MNSWLEAMKQWTQWLMGDAPLPDGRSKAVLAGTVAAAAVGGGRTARGNPLEPVGQRRVADGRADPRRAPTHAP